MTDLRKLLEAATKGPWRAYCRDVRYEGGEWSEDEFLQWEISGPSDHTGRGSYLQKDAALIVAAINALPDLLDVVDAAQRFTTLNLCAGQSTDDDVALDAAFDALTAALAQWEKRK